MEEWVEQMAVAVVDSLKLGIAGAGERHIALGELESRRGAEPGERRN